MKHLFLPKMYIKNFKYIDLDVLRKHHIKVIILDIDNTLAPHDISEPSEDTINFLHLLEKEGFKICVVSNNNKRRVEAFARHIGCFYVNNALKPLPFAFLHIAHKFHVKCSEMAMCGDQLLTDMAGANFVGCFSILCTPLVLRDITVTRFNRKFENKIFDYLETKTRFKKGEYYNE